MGGSALRRVCVTVLVSALAARLPSFRGGRGGPGGMVGVEGTPCSPNLCNGRGSCESSADGSTSAKQCSCFDNWQGADCSLKTCPFGAAWNDIADGVDDAHNRAECSNRGSCNRATGQCECDGTFEGQACERLRCPNNCSGHGKCQSLSYFSSVKDSGEGTVYAYEDVWDAEKIQGCHCDEGYWGPDCSLRHCPTGDDPLTGTEEDPDGEQENEVHEVTCTATGGTFTLAFRGFTTTALAWDCGADDIVDALEALPSIPASYDDAISVAFSSSDTQACTSAGHTFTIEFLQNFGDLPLLVAGTTSLSHSSTGISASVLVSEYVAGSKEDNYCSDRGVCDVGNGVCTCEDEVKSSDGYNEAGRRGDCGYVYEAITHCPGEIACSGHGVCNGSPTYACDCSDGWMGGDCSLKTCPEGKSWFSLPSADEEAHLTYAECSDMGICDRSSGECSCMENFEGSACDRMSCPGASTGGGESAVCNGHGQCLPMGQLAENADDNGDATDYTYGATPNKATTWDHDMIYGCLCDSGYFGHDCMLRSCPKGDDADTYRQANEIQTIMCTDDDQDGTLIFTFRQSEADSLAPTSTSKELEAALEDLDSIVDVAVECDTSNICATNGTLCTVEFYTETGNVPLIHIAAEEILSVNITETTTGTKEYVECSHKGLCDYDTGVCNCFPGYGSSDGQNNKGTLGDCGYLTPITPRAAPGAAAAAPWSGGASAEAAPQNFEAIWRHNRD